VGYAESMSRVGSWIGPGSWIKPGSLAALGVLLVAGCEQPAPERPPIDHVLVILVDTLRADALGAWGAPEGATPALDAFADQSTVFLNAHTQGSFTASSVTSIFAGRRIAEESVKMHDGVPTLAEQFQAAGFATGAFICNDIINEKSGYARGFDSMLQLTPYSDNGPIVEWFAAHSSARTFAYVHLNEAHDPYEPPGEWIDKRANPDPIAAERRALFERVHEQYELVDFDASVAHIETEIGGYADDVSYSDARIGALIDAARAAWPPERTAIVVTSDHGEGLWTRVAMLSGKRGQSLRAGDPQTLATTLMPTHGNQVTRELSHVPLIVAAPGFAPARIDGLVEMIDLFPTLLELAHLPLPADLPGESLVARMRGAREPAGDAFTFTRFNASLITSDGWQLIRPTLKGVCEESVVIQLYDLGTDPEARVNVAEQHPELVERLEALVVERLRTGLRGFDQDLTPQDAANLADLGYLELLDEFAPELLRLPTPELLTILSEATECVDRLGAARALGSPRTTGAGDDERKVERELTPEILATLAERRDLEGSPAVREALDAVLGS